MRDSKVIYDSEDMRVTSHSFENESVEAYISKGHGVSVFYDRKDYGGVSFNMSYSAAMHLRNKLNELLPE